MSREKEDFEPEIDRLFDNFMDDLFTMRLDYDDSELMKKVERYLGNFDIRDAFVDGLEDYS